jgi:hypothetical protein
LSGVDILRKSFDVVGNFEPRPPWQGLVYVRRGIMSRRMLELVYPEMKEEHRPKVERALLGKEYGIMFMDLHNGDGFASYHLAEIKGKVMLTERPDGFGLRKMFNAMEIGFQPHGGGQEIMRPLPKESNYLHIPDNEYEAVGLYNWLLNSKESIDNEIGGVLFYSENELLMRDESKPKQRD